MLARCPPVIGALVQVEVDAEVEVEIAASRVASTRVSGSPRDGSAVVGRKALDARSRAVTADDCGPAAPCVRDMHGWQVLSRRVAAAARARVSAKIKAEIAVTIGVRIQRDQHGSLAAPALELDRTGDVAREQTAARAAHIARIVGPAVLARRGGLRRAHPRIRQRRRAPPGARFGGACFAGAIGCASGPALRARSRSLGRRRHAVTGPGRAGSPSPGSRTLPRPSRR